MNALATKSLTPSVSHALAILRHLAAERRGEGVTAIARAVGLSPSSAFNILKTLSAEGFAEFDPATKSYSIGEAAIEIARTALDPANAFQRVRADIARIARQQNATTSLWRVTGNERLVLLVHADSGEGTRIDLSPGQRLPLLAGAGGRCVAAGLHLDDSRLEAAFRKLRWDSPPDWRQWRADVRQAQATGWAIDSDHSIRGVASVAAAIRDHGGAARFSLTCTFFSAQTDQERLEAIGGVLVRESAALAIRLFGKPPALQRPE